MFTKWNTFPVLIHKLGYNTTYLIFQILILIFIVCCFFFHKHQSIGFPHSLLSQLYHRHNGSSSPITIKCCTHCSLLFFCRVTVNTLLLKYHLWLLGDCHGWLFPVYYLWHKSRPIHPEPLRKSYLKMPVIIHLHTSLVNKLLCISMDILNNLLLYIYYKV